MTGTSGPKHILIVEDSPDLQILLARLFKAENYQVSRASNGQEALHLLNSLPELPTLILLDIMMPIMDGLEFREHQQKDPRFSRIPVVVMTADSNYQARVIESGVAAFIRKPIQDVTKLLELVESL